MRFPLFLLLGALLFVGSSCGDDEDEMPMMPEDNQAVSATILRIVLTGGTAGSQTFSYREVPPEEPGTVLPPEIDDIVLEANTSYSYRLIIQGESPNGTRNLNPEIEEDGEDYIVTFDVLAANLDITLTDEDDFGDPIGLSGTFQTGTVSSGVLMFDLYFETSKASPGSGGDRLLAGDFRVEIQ